jgi:hypothetical protein
MFNEGTNQCPGTLPPIGREVPQAYMSFTCNRAKNQEASSMFGQKCATLRMPPDQTRSVNPYGLDMGNP